MSLYSHLQLSKSEEDVKKPPKTLIKKTLSYTLTIKINPKILIELL